MGAPGGDSDFFFFFYVGSGNVTLRKGIHFQFHVDVNKDGTYF